MKAVNLIPVEARRSGRPTLPAAAVAPYAVLAVLALAVVLAGTWALAGKGLADKQAELARVEREAQAAEAKGASLAPYTTFAAMRKARVETVAGLLQGRFDWAHSLREVARIVPSDVDLTSMVGTVSPESRVEGSGGVSLRGSLPVPALDLIGCAKSQSRVAVLLARLRAIDGVDRVSLASSEKSDSASLNATDCRATVGMPQFQLTVFYKAQDGIVPSAHATATTAAGAAPGADSGAPAGGAK